VIFVYLYLGLFPKAAFFGQKPSAVTAGAIGSFLHYHLTTSTSILIDDGVCRCCQSTGAGAAITAGFLWAQVYRPFKIVYVLHSSFVHSSIPSSYFLYLVDYSNFYNGKNL
jgi:hypothetical protein